jgi:hypothetical protein
MEIHSQCLEEQDKESRQGKNEPSGRYAWVALSPGGGGGNTDQQEVPDVKYHGQVTCLVESHHDSAMSGVSIGRVRVQAENSKAKP